MPLDQLAQAAQGAAAAGESTGGLSFEIPPLPPDVLFNLGPLGFTNTSLFTWLVMLVVIVLAVLSARRLKEVPAARSWQTFAEVVINALLNLAESAVGRHRARQIFPLMATLFIFILTANWLGLLPLSGPFYIVKEGAEKVDLFRSVNADWSNTLALALITFVATEFWGLRHRPREHLMHFVKPLGVGQIELVSEFVRVLSLSVRLFGNLFAGEVLVTVMTGLTKLAVPAVFLVLETLFGFIQATVFTVLCLAYFTLNTTAHHAESHEEVEADNPVHPSAA
jgi:F-type H+-transporting ATPase subunit a